MINLPKKERIIVWAIYLVITVGVILGGVKAVSLHKSNIVWCISHADECKIARLVDQKELLEKATEVAR